MSFQRLYPIISVEVLKVLKAAASVSIRFLEILTNRNKIFRRFSIKNFWIYGVPQPGVTEFLGLNSLQSRFSWSKKIRRGFLKDRRILRSENEFSGKRGKEPGRNN